MGQAAQRRKAIETRRANLLAGLSGDALVVAETAIGFFDRFIMPKRFTGGCYVVNATLHLYLKDELGIATDPVVGYVTDGTDDVLISHAWLEHEGRKTDLTLAVTDHRISRPGALLVQDVILQHGDLRYRHHREATVEGMAMNATMMRDPAIAPLLMHKSQEHTVMTARFANEGLMRAYLADAPADQTYEAMTSVLRK